MCNKRVSSERLGYGDGYIYAFAWTLYRISEQLSYLWAGTKHSVLALFQIEPTSWNQTKPPNNKITTTKFLLSPPLSILPIFFFFHTDILPVFWVCFFFFETSGLKILGHLGILGASDRSGAERREALGRPQRGEGCAGACAWEKGGTRGAKEATYIFRRRRKKKRNFKREKK